MDHVGILYHQRNGFYLVKRKEQLPLSGQVHLPNADKIYKLEVFLKIKNK